MLQSQGTRHIIRLVWRLICLVVNIVTFNLLRGPPEYSSLTDDPKYWQVVRSEELRTAKSGAVARRLEKIGWFLVNWCGWLAVFGLLAPSIIAIGVAKLTGVTPGWWIVKVSRATAVLGFAMRQTGASGRVPGRGVERC